MSAAILPLTSNDLDLLEGDSELDITEATLLARKAANRRPGAGGLGMKKRAFDDSLSLWSLSEEDAGEPPELVDDETDDEEGTVIPPRTYGRSRRGEQTTKRRFDNRALATRNTKVKHPGFAPMPDHYSLPATPGDEKACPDTPLDKYSFSMTAPSTPHPGLYDHTHTNVGGVFLRDDNLHTFIPEDPSTPKAKSVHRNNDSHTDTSMDTRSSHTITANSVSTLKAALDSLRLKHRGNDTALIPSYSAPTPSESSVVSCDQ